MEPKQSSQQVAWPLNAKSFPISPHLPHRIKSLQNRSVLISRRLFYLRSSIYDWLKTLHLQTTQSPYHTLLICLPKGHRPLLVLRPADQKPILCCVIQTDVLLFNGYLEQLDWKRLSIASPGTSLLLYTCKQFSKSLDND